MSTRKALLPSADPIYRDYRRTQQNSTAATMPTTPRLSAVQPADPGTRLGWGLQMNSSGSDARTSGSDHAAERTRRVVIIQRVLTHYRIPFFEKLRSYLLDQGILLDVVYGDPYGAEARKRDTGVLEWGRPIKNRVLRVAQRELTWQPCLKLLRGADLVIVEQASRLLLNYLLFVGQRLGGPKVALWGHGQNLNAPVASRTGEAVKRALSRQPHWWFAYNDFSAQIVSRLGFPPERITSVQNTIDVTTLREQRQRITEMDVAKVRERLGLVGRNVGIFSGGLYAEKRIEFMFAAAHEARALLPDFELIVIGAGPEEALVAETAQRTDWIHWVGPLFDEEKAAHFAVARVVLMPGLVGLAVMDSFALEVPMITVDLPSHSPEIEYLLDGINGLKLESGATASEYAHVVHDLLRDEALHERLREGCRRAAETYTLEAMVERFAKGVIAALG